MFQNAFQGGPSVEVLHSCDKNPSWSLNKPNWRFYEKAVKGYVILVDSQSSKLTMPSSDKQTLSLVQPFLVLQIFLIPTQSFTLELAVTDIMNSKRRLVFSSTSKELVVNPLHARIPNPAFIRGTWANISIDMARCVQSCFPGSTFRSLDSLIVSAFCKIRRIFTMRSALPDTTGAEISHTNCEQVPKALDYPSGVTYMNQLINPELLFPITVKSVESKDLPKKSTTRVPLTTTPLNRLKKPPEHTSPVAKRPGNTTTAFFLKKQKDALPPTKASIQLSKQESPKEARVNSAASKRYSQQLEEEKGFNDCGNEEEKEYNDCANEEEKESVENPLEDMDYEDKDFNEFHHLTNYRDCDDLANSIQEEIEVESVQQEVESYNRDAYMQPEHKYFPHEEQHEEMEKPTFFDFGLNQATQCRPYTPPFTGIKNPLVDQVDEEEEAVELVFDPVLQCYYDPSTMEYYQINE